MMHIKALSFIYRIMLAGIVLASTMLLYPRIIRAQQPTTAFVYEDCSQPLECEYPSCIPSKYFIFILPSANLTIQSISLTDGGKGWSSDTVTTPWHLKGGVVDTFVVFLDSKGNFGGDYIYLTFLGTYDSSHIELYEQIQETPTFTQEFENSDIYLSPRSVCDSAVDTTLCWLNSSCDTTDVGLISPDTSIPEPGWSFSMPQFGPIPPGGCYPIHILSMGHGRQQIHLHYEGGPGTFNIIPQLFAPATLDVSQPFPDTLTICGNDTTDTIKMVHSGCDTLDMALTHSGDALFSGNDSAWVLLPGSESSYSALFSPLRKGLHTDTITIHGQSRRYGFPNYDDTVIVQALVTDGSRIASLNAQSLDVGNACQPRDSAVTILNTGCDTLTIYGDSIDSKFSLADTVHFPIVLPPLTKAVFPVFANDDTIGHPTSVSGTLRFTTNSDSLVLPILLSAEISYPGQVSLHLAPSTTSAVPGKVFSMNIYPNAPLSDIGLDTISFTLHYWNDLLNLENPPAPVTVQNGEASVPITIIGNNLALDPTTPIATLNFEAMLTDTIHTTLALSSPIANPSDPSYASCVLSLSTDSTPFTLDLLCGDSTILAGMENTAPFSITGIVPNPAQDEITIGVAAVGDHHAITCEMFDALGREQDGRSTSLPSAITLDVSLVPSGIYFLRVSSGGYVESRSVVVEH